MRGVEIVGGEVMGRRRRKKQTNRKMRRPVYVRGCAREYFFSLARHELGGGEVVRKVKKVGHRIL